MHGPYLKKGETITCPNGHEICDANRDIGFNELVAVEDFENWRWMPAKPGDRPICRECGEEYIRWTTGSRWDGAEPHTKRGWRSEYENE